ncbi:hypothetical protein NSTC745_05142 [Nostoc sp. DSM 114161]|jgi:hypothetical protein
MTNRPLAKVLFVRGGKREKVMVRQAHQPGERENNKPFPLPLFPTSARSLMTNDK